ncbi:MAG: hypothetical protein IPN30_06455 [Flavobacteriales bacterium]|nr:hypothetical protein [Flavobacteriales bacterium]
MGWVLSRRLGNGWFQDADNTIQHNQRPITTPSRTPSTVSWNVISARAYPGLLHAAELPARALAERFFGTVV